MSDLVGNPEDRFSQNKAHIILQVNKNMAACKAYRMPNTILVSGNTLSTPIEELAHKKV